MLGMLLLKHWGIGEVEKRPLFHSTCTGVLIFEVSKEIVVQITLLGFYQCMQLVYYISCMGASSILLISY